MRGSSCLLLVLMALSGCITQPDSAAPGPPVPGDARTPGDMDPMNDGQIEPRDVALPMDAIMHADQAAPRPDAGSVSDGPDVMPDAAPAPDGGQDAAPRPMIDECLGMLLDGAPFIADYAIFDPVIGRHCRGTDHQAIVDVEQVVFVGDALMTSSTRNRVNLVEPMRAQVATALAERHGLQPPATEWHGLDPLTGRPALRRSGDFIACADPLAEVADLLDGPRLLVDCLLPEEYGRRTLFIVTIGIRDVRRLTGVLADGADDGQTLSVAGQSIDALEQAVRWMMDPVRFPAGSFVVFSNVPDWTDGRGDTAACRDWPALPDERQRFFGQMLAHINGQYMRIAVEQGADLVFMQEHFCGHGIHHLRPDPLCLGVPEPWLDESCRFLVPAGETELSRLFWDVITDAE